MKQQELVNKIIEVSNKISRQSRYPKANYAVLSSATLKIIEEALRPGNRKEKIKRIFNEE